MNFIRFLLAIIAMLLPVLTSVAEQPRGLQMPLEDSRPIYTIYTASSRTSFFQMGNDVARACPELNVQVEQTDGSLDNINRLIQVPVTKAGYRFAIVQQDALSSVYKTEPKTRSMISMVSALFEMDITVIANRGAHIKSLSDLQGKRVAIGSVGSGIWFTANRIKAELGLNWESVERTPEETMLAVLTGDVDAMFVTGGHPIKLYTELSAAVKNRITFVDMSDPHINKLYSISHLPENTYLWQDKSAYLRKTRSIFVAASDVPPAAVSTLLSCIANSQDELKKWGSPKWRASLLQMRK